MHAFTIESIHTHTQTFIEKSITVWNRRKNTHISRERCREKIYKSQNKIQHTTQRSDNMEKWSIYNNLFKSSFMVARKTNHNTRFKIYIKPTIEWMEECQSGMNTRTQNESVRSHDTMTETAERASSTRDKLPGCSKCWKEKREILVFQMRRFCVMWSWTGRKSTTHRILVVGAHLIVDGCCCCSFLLLLADQAYYHIFPFRLLI